MITRVKKNKNNPAEPALIVSVESRKGGVGKTTAALCLARQLRTHDYSVLVLDLDVTGTNAADIANTPFWQEDLHVIKDMSKETPLPLNFLTLFDQCFMTGMKIPRFSNQDTEAESMVIDLEKVNILGSQIYKTDKLDTMKGITCIKRPGILFDDLHTLWLLEFVKEVIYKFVSTARSTEVTKSAKVAVILDNSPGYVGIAPSIHEWLTDLGPSCGKFLTVTSLDVQDLLACEMAIRSLHELYEGKWKTSRLFKRASKADDGVKVGKDQEVFFMRLATSSNTEISGDDSLTFYKQESNSNQNGDEFCIHPNKYTGLIINRVPRAIKTGRLEYELPTGIVCEAGAVQKLFNGNDIKDEWRKRMISYDEYIENQFMPQLLQRIRKRSERQLHNLIRFLDKADHELRIESKEHLYEIGTFSQDGFGRFKELTEQLSKTNAILIRARSALDAAGLGHLARLILNEWLPESILSDFRSSLSKLMIELDFVQFDHGPFEFEPASATQKAKKVTVQFKEHILLEMYDLLKQQNMIDDSTVNMLASFLSVLGGLTLTSLWWREPFQKELTSLFATVLAIELSHWPKRGEERHHKPRLQHFLSQEFAKDVNFENEMEIIRNSRISRHNYMREEMSNIVDFYRACTYAQARLIDFLADSRFLLQLISFMVKSENQKGVLFPYIRGIAEDVIVNKSVTHEEAPRRMEKALKTAEYFREFDTVLKKVLTDWGVIHE